LCGAERAMTAVSRAPACCVCKAGGAPVTRTQQRCFWQFWVIKKNQNGDDSWEAVVFSRFFWWRNS